MKQEKRDDMTWNVMDTVGIDRMHPCTEDKARNERILPVNQIPYFSFAEVSHDVNSGEIDFTDGCFQKCHAEFARHVYSVHSMCNISEGSIIQTGNMYLLLRLKLWFCSGYIAHDSGAFRMPGEVQTDSYGSLLLSREDI